MSEIDTLLTRIRNTIDILQIRRAGHAELLPLEFARVDDHTLASKALLDTIDLVSLLDPVPT